MGIDWTANTAISDQLRQEEADHAFVQAIVGRLSHPSRSVQFLALKLLEFCMKNCGQDLRLPRAVATKQMMDALTALAENRRPRARGLFAFRCSNSSLTQGPSSLEDDRHEEHDVNELARVLIRSWAEGFDAVRTDVPLFGATYQRLLSRGLGFPELNSEEKMEFKLPSPAQVEVEIIGERVRLLRDVLGVAETESPVEDMAGELTGELEQTREELQRRIPGIEDEEALSIYLRALDQVESVLQQYWERVRAKVTEATAAEGSQAEEYEGVAGESDRDLAMGRQKDSELGQYAPSQDEPWPTVPAAPTGTAENQTSGDIADLLGLNSPRSVPSVA